MPASVPRRRAAPRKRTGARCQRSAISYWLREGRRTRITGRPRAASSGTDASRWSRSSTRRMPETYEGIPVVASVNDALCFNPTTALVGVATQGGRFPPEWRELLKASIGKGLDLENGLHEFVSEDGELVELARRHGVELRDLRKPPPDLNVPTGANLDVPATIALTVGSDCAIGKMTVSLELGRAPPVSAGWRPSSCRPARPESRSRGGGSPSTPSSRTSSRGRRAARRRGLRAGRTRPALGRGPGLRGPPGLLGRDARPDPRLGPAPLRPLSHGRDDRGGGGIPGTRCRRCRS